MPQRYHPDHKDALDTLLLALPGVTEGQMFGHPSYKIAGKIFASLMEEGVTVKLPAETVQTLLEQENITPFAPLGNPMRQWVLIHVSDAAEYVNHLTVFEQALTFVLEEATKK